MGKKSQKYDNALMTRVRTIESERRYKYGETWQHTGGRLFLISKILYFVAFGFSLFWNIIYLLSYSLQISDMQTNAAKFADDLAEANKRVFIVCLLTVLIIVSFVFVLLKKYLPALLMTGISSVILAVMYFQQLQSVHTFISEFFLKYFLRHLLPLTPLTVTLLILYIIAHRDRKAEQMAYEHAAALLYQSRDNKERMMTQEEWLEMIANYNGETQFHRLKRSQRDAQRKKESESPPSEE